MPLRRKLEGHRQSPNRWSVARSSQTVKAAYREVVESMIRLFEANSHGPKAREQALVLIALCVGGMVLARGLDDEDLADDIRNAAHKHALKIASWREHRLREGKRRRSAIRRH